MYYKFVHVITDEMKKKKNNNKMYEFLITGIKNSLNENSFCISQIMTGTFAHLFLDQHMEVVEVAIATVRLWHLFLISTSLSCTHCKHGVSLPRILVRFLHHSCCQKQYGTKFRNPYTEHALQGGKKVIYIKYQYLQVDIWFKTFGF